ncbi:MAG: hypothetical protein ACYC3Q_07990 [Gemmatimonadaceae bacterium]
MRFPRLLAVTALALAAACAPRQVEVGTGTPTTGAINSAESLIRAMRDRYAADWYRNLTFTQTSIFYRADGTENRRETWYEAGSLPGKLRIDFGSPTAGNGVLYVGDSSFTFSGGKLANAAARRNPLMVLGFDVYAQPAERTIEVLRAEGFDLSKFHEATVNGTKYYVVGAGATDTTSKQFWVEADRLLFWRTIEPAPRQPATLTETRFQKYVKHGGGWVAEEVDFLRNGKRVFFERYSDVRVNQPLDPGIFNPRTYMSAPHWRR